MAGQRPPTRRSARNLGERERAAGIDPDDDAARWLREHDPEPEPAPPRNATKSKALHLWRRRHARGGR